MIKTFLPHCHPMPSRDEGVSAARSYDRSRTTSDTSANDGLFDLFLCVITVVFIVITLTLFSSLTAHLG